MSDIVILSARRTPLGKFLGCFKDISSPELGAAAIKATLTETGIAPALIQEVYMGCVLPAGLGQAPARQAALKAGLAQETSCTTVNKVCGSGMKAVMCAYDSLLQDDASFIIAGGMESMSNAPYLLKGARLGFHIHHQTVYDHLMLDGLEDAYEKGCSMGVFADRFAAKQNFTRQDQDTYAARSLTCAQTAIADHAFDAEIAPVETNTDTFISVDERPKHIHTDKIPLLKPAFSPQGTVTAANASANADGAAALLMTSSDTALKHKLKPLAKIIGHASAAKSPADFTSAPQVAIQKLLTKIHWKLEDVDLFEINEAFAVVALGCMRDLQIPLAKINIHGGSCALGHPIGASGARIIVTLVHALKRHQLKRGIAAICIGGGEATAIAIELM